MNGTNIDVICKEQEQSKQTSRFSTTITNQSSPNGEQRKEKAYRHFRARLHKKDLNNIINKNSESSRDREDNALDEQMGLAKKLASKYDPQVEGYQTDKFVHLSDIDDEGSE